MKKLLITAIAALTLVLVGCAFNPQQADLNPTISVMKTNEGKGVTVAVKVVDERPSKSLGRRGTAYGAAAEITAVQDLATVVHGEIVAALESKGFTVSDYTESANTRLKAEVRLLEYSTSTGFWTGGVQVNGAIKIIAEKDGETYERMFRTEDQKRVVFVPGAKSNESMINESLSSLLNQVFADRALILHLSN